MEYMYCKVDSAVDKGEDAEIMRKTHDLFR